MLEDFGGVEDEAFGKGQAAVGSALDAALYGGLEPFPEDESGVPLPREPSSFEMKPGIFMMPSPVVPNSSGSGGLPDLCPPPSAFQQPTYASSGPLTPPTPSKQLPQKPRSIRRARSSLAAHGQNRSESEPQELFMRRANSSELPDAAVLAKQGVGNSPRSSSSAYVPFSAMNAVEVYPEVCPTPPPSLVSLSLADVDSLWIRHGYQEQCSRKGGQLTRHARSAGSTGYGERQEDQAARLRPEQQ